MVHVRYGVLIAPGEIFENLLEGQGLLALSQYDNEYTNIRLFLCI